MATGSGFQPGVMRELYPGGTTASTTHLLAFAVLGVVVVVATRGRLGDRGAGDARQPVCGDPRTTAVVG